MIWQLGKKGTRTFITMELTCRVRSVNFFVGFAVKRLLYERVVVPSTTYEKETLGMTVLWRNKGKFFRNEALEQYVRTDRANRVSNAELSFTVDVSGKISCKINEPQAWLKVEAVFFLLGSVKMDWLDNFGEILWLDCTKYHRLG